MKIPSRGGFVALVLCASAAVSVTPALAAEQAGGTAPDRTGTTTTDGTATDGTATGGAATGGAATGGAATGGAATGGAATGGAATGGAATGGATMGGTAAGDLSTGSGGEPRVPLIVPLESMETSLPLDAPAVGGSFPALPVKPPTRQDMTPEMTRDGGVEPRATIPPLRTQGTPSAFVEAPVPTLQERGGRSAARIETPQAPLDTSGPEASLGLPIGAPSTDRSGTPGLPELKAPDASVTSPAAKGEPHADVGVTQKDEEQRLPVGPAMRTASEVLPAAGKAVRDTRKDLDLQRR
ncbi:hypothetical protein [Streptomyces sp. 8N616]|uniref:hypothetical protein n=1 Tax=Streptomyces sp. 8N616 TaxID=3457414 RepID=UPI003FD162CF